MIKDLLPPDSQRIVYDIRRDAVGLELKQKASLSKSEAGIELTYGLIGSPDWWLAIEGGRLKLENFPGKIRVIAGGMTGDTLMVHIEGLKEKQRWVAWRGFSQTLDGKNVCTRYVRMLPKTPIKSKPDFLIPVLLQVELLD
ncbi:MAG TPA: hypothetical protein VGY98_16935 [Verrucomicrobiae bacterium]|nr:hypothetical protein [Verrucomicrobiae bacterium]